MTVKSKQDRQISNLMAIVRNGGFDFTDTFFPYTSGKIGPYYIQGAVVQNSARDYRAACDSMTEVASEEVPMGKIGVIAGGETRDWMFSFPLADRLEKRHMMIYKDGKVRGAKNLDGAKVLHVADLNNEGSSPREQWVPAIREAEGEINHILFYVDRLEGGNRVMEEMGLERHVVVPLDEYAWNYLREQEVVGEETYKNIRERMEGKDEWARKMLGSERGLETLAELVHSRTDKAINILYNGYPDMREELIDAMNDRGMITRGKLIAIRER